jgi:3-deoxy-7-phosphoheptulonate synthase
LKEEAMPTTENLNIREIVPLIAPGELKRILPMDEASIATVVESRKIVQAILEGKDPRILAIVGPCSIHDTDAALEYARRFKSLRDKVGDKLFLLMRVYFEKPRTTVGWKGFINDPFLDDSCDISTGVREARRLLLQINAMGIPAATEFLDPIVPQYIADLVTWAAIGARTTESQTHRQMASGLSMPVGFKNGTDGNIQVAVDALQSARFAHNFLGLDSEGRTAIVKTRGNPWGHVVLRGGFGSVEEGRPGSAPGGGLQPRKHPEAARTAGSGVAQHRRAEDGREHGPGGRHGGKQPLRRQPEDTRRQVTAALRGLGYRPMRGMGDHRAHGAEGP